MTRPFDIPSEPPVPALTEQAAVAVDDAVIQEVVKGYYASAVGSADAARTRAQNGYAIASAVAAAIVAGGVLAGIGDAGPLVQGFAFASLVAWLSAAGVFMYAVAGSVSGLISADQPDASHFVDAVLRNVRTERGAISGRSARAQLITAIAILLTVLGVGAALLDSVGSPSINVNARLLPAGSRAVKDLCGGTAPAQVSGSTNPDRLGDTFVSISLDADSCAGASSTLQINRRNISAFSEPSD